MLLKKGMKKQFLFLTLLHLTAISAILRADCYYKDDMGRAYAGYQGWDNFSMPPVNRRDNCHLRDYGTDRGLDMVGDSGSSIGAVAMFFGMYFI